MSFYEACEPEDKIQVRENTYPPTGRQPAYVQLSIGNE